MKNDFTPPVHCWVQWPDWQHPYLTMLTQNIFDKLLISVIMYQHAKNQFIPSVSIFRYSQFSRCITWLATPIFDHVHPKNVQSTLRCVKLYQYAKNHLVPSFLSWDTINFRVSRPDWWHSILTIPCQKLFNQLLIFVNLYQHGKNETGEIFDLKILQSEWQTAFLPTPQEQHFSQIEYLYRNNFSLQKKIREN